MFKLVIRNNKHFNNLRKPFIMYIEKPRVIGEIYAYKWTDVNDSKNFINNPQTYYFRGVELNKNV